MILRVNKSKETELSTKDKPDEENSLSTKESFTGKIGVTIGDLDNYKKDSLINIWKDANAYYSSGEEWTDEDAEFFDELAVRINTATEEGIGTVSGPAVGMVANKEFDYKNNEDEKAIKDEGLNGDDGLGFGQHNESFNEEDHPRDEDGQFASGSGSNNGSSDSEPEEQKTLTGSSTPDEIKTINDSLDFETQGHYIKLPNFPFKENGKWIEKDIVRQVKPDLEYPEKSTHSGMSSELDLDHFEDSSGKMIKSGDEIEFTDQYGSKGKIIKTIVKVTGFNYDDRDEWEPPNIDGYVISSTDEEEYPLNQAKRGGNSRPDESRIRKSSDIKMKNGESLDQILLNETYIQDQFGVFYRPVYVGENYKEHESDLVFEGKLYTTEGVGNCPFCKGAGKITVEKLGLKDCPDCDGTGDVQGEQEMPQEVPPQEVPQQEMPVEEEVEEEFIDETPETENMMMSDFIDKEEGKEHYDKDGTYWFTTDNGKKVGVKKGQTLEDALSASGIPDDGVDQSDVTAEDMAKNEDNDKPKEDKSREDDNEERYEKLFGRISKDAQANQDIYSQSNFDPDVHMDGDLLNDLRDAGVTDDEIIGYVDNLDDLDSTKQGDFMKDNYGDKSTNVPSAKSISDKQAKDFWDNLDKSDKIGSGLDNVGNYKYDRLTPDEQMAVKERYTDQFKSREQLYDEFRELKEKYPTEYGMDAHRYVSDTERLLRGKPTTLGVTLNDGKKTKDNTIVVSDSTDWIHGDNRIGHRHNAYEEIFEPTQVEGKDGVWEFGGSYTNEKQMKRLAKMAKKDGTLTKGNVKTLMDEAIIDADPSENKPIAFKLGGKTYWTAPTNPNYEAGESFKSKSCGCKKKGLEASISKYEKFIKTEINVLKTRAKAGEAVGLMYGLPTVRKNGKKIKGTLAYAGVSLNDRIYLPEELAKGHGKTLPLLLNHSSTAGAEEEMDRLDGEMRDHLENEKDYEVGEVTLTWDADKLTLFYEGVIENEFFQKEVDDMDMAVSLGIFYDSNSPKVCDEECYTLIKGAEFREVSLVYHAGFPIATIEAVESKLKRASIKDIKAKANEDSLVKIEDNEDADTQVTVLDEWKNETDPDVDGETKGIRTTKEAIAEEEDELPRGGSIDAEPKETDTIEQPQIIVESLQTQDSFSVRGVSGMTISNSNGVEKYAFDPTQNYSTNTIHFSVTEQGGTIFGEEMQLTPKMTTPDELTKEIESKPDIKFTDADEDILKKN